MAHGTFRVARDVFRPSHILPTMTVEEAGEMEYRELMERTARQAANAKAAADARTRTATPSVTPLGVKVS